MKKLFLNLALLLLASALFAQITVTNATFPSVGDSLKTATDFTPNGIVISSPGGPQIWDFTSLGVNAQQVTVFRAASEGAAFANFPNAELVTIGQAGAETYYNVSATSFENLGFSGTDPTGGLPVQTEFKFNPPVPERIAPLNFIDIHMPESSVNVAFSLADIPGGVLDSLGIPTNFVDSIRIKVTASRIELVDAYGTLAIPGGTYEVLREKRTEYTDTRIEIHLPPPINWFDVTNQAGAGAGFGKDTTISYLFISNTEKEIIATVTTDVGGTTPQQVTFKDNGVLSGTNDPVSAKQVVSVLPNPVGDVARFEFKNWEPGNYDLRIFDMQGKMVLENNLQLNGNQTEPIQCGPLPAGTYFYQIIHVDGKLVGTGRFIKQG
ncbi:MAG: T9SS type A sorting domain-containing protein [Lewinellaceae bacterium]|nr:T9SS type A sorting domain-containing protein [Saprospiraceae bacterium]MCB9337936.1 T9SS type A sorting domain-containing protein [Lewinellaceae bacterium]